MFQVELESARLGYVVGREVELGVDGLGENSRSRICNRWHAGDMDGLAGMRDDAREYVKLYVDPAGPYAFRTYDRTSRPVGSELLPEDVLAANLLSLKLSQRDVIPLFAEPRLVGEGDAHEGRTVHQVLLERMNTALVDLRGAPAIEDVATESELIEVLAPLVAANEAALAVPNWTAVTVSKVLHRHLPQIVPIVDSRVRAFYGVTRNGPKLRGLLWNDLRENLDWLRPLAGEFARPDGQPLSVLRLADNIIWMSGGKGAL